MDSEDWKNDDRDIKFAVRMGFWGGVLSILFAIAAFLLVTHIAGLWDVVY